MKLERLRMLRDELNSEFLAENIESEVFYCFLNQWHKLDDPNINSGEFTDFLKRAKNEPVAYHAPSDRIAWFCCPNDGCTVSLKFVSSPKKATRDAARKRLDHVLSRANNAYKVAYNPMTLLLARDEFRVRLIRVIESLKDGEVERAEDDEVSQRAVALCAFDIDHFKQINDTYGHMYGDQVLKTFARRLETTAKKLIDNSGKAIEIELGHPSGEEFLVLISGNLDKDEMFSFADALRKEIEDVVLPSDQEWGWLKERENLASVVLPPLHERHVSASVGFAVHSALNSEEDISAAAARLLKNADTALYRAKAAGRNQAISFDSILTNCGRVLEQDDATRVIAIDIGKNVGVTVGQEFRVLPPTYNGKKKFTISDGRTVRTLGVYPKVELVRITVFDAQAELSFAFISNANEAAINVEPGSHLEAIPIGSIGHALPHAARYFVSASDGVRIGDISSLQDLVDKLSDNDTSPFAAVFRFSRATDYLRRYGTLALNGCLTKLFRTVSAAFHFPSITGVLDTVSVCVVGTQQVYAKVELEELVKRLNDDLPEIGVVAGIFVDRQSNATHEKNAAGLNSRHAIEFARFAASEHAAEPNHPIAEFVPAIASKILVRQRNLGQFSSALVDYEKLVSLGVESAHLMNQGGLICSKLGDKVRAAELFLAASTRDPEAIVFKSNFSTVATALGDEGVFKALELLNALSDDEVDDLMQLHPFGYVSYARLLARAKLAGSDGYVEGRFNKIAPIVLNMSAFAGSRLNEPIREALAIN